MASVVSIRIIYTKVVCSACDGSVTGVGGFTRIWFFFLFFFSLLFIFYRVAFLYSLICSHARFTQFVRRYHLSIFPSFRLLKNDRSQKKNKLYMRGIYARFFYVAVRAFRIICVNLLIVHIYALVPTTAIPTCRLWLCNKKGSTRVKVFTRHRRC